MNPVQVYEIRLKPSALIPFDFLKIKPALTFLNFDLILELDYDEINHKQSESCILNTIPMSYLNYTY